MIMFLLKLRPTMIRCLWEMIMNVIHVHIWIHMNSSYKFIENENQDYKHEHIVAGLKWISCFIGYIDWK